MTLVSLNEKSTTSHDKSQFVCYYMEYNDYVLCLCCIDICLYYINVCMFVHNKKRDVGASPLVTDILR